MGTSRTPVTPTAARPRRPTTRSLTTPARTHLVNLDGETDPDAIADEMPASYDEYARRLLH